MSPPAKAPDERWVAGHDAGYVKGRDDGMGIGYFDAKTRAFLAIDSLEAAKGKGVTTREVRTALTDMLGKQS